MSPKEKSKELIDKFFSHAFYSIHDLIPRLKMLEEQRENAIECALICVHELIIEGEQFNHEEIKEDRFKFWESVKNELNSM